MDVADQARATLVPRAWGLFNATSSAAEASVGRMSIRLVGQMWRAVARRGRSPAVLIMVLH